MTKKDENDIFDLSGIPTQKKTVFGSKKGITYTLIKFNFTRTFKKNSRTKFGNLVFELESVDFKKMKGRKFAPVSPWFFQ